jgi:hypothetical protein
LFRRAEGLSLSLQHRLPDPGSRAGRPPGLQLGITAAWASVLIVWPWF